MLLALAGQDFWSFVQGWGWIAHLILLTQIFRLPVARWSLGIALLAPAAQRLILFWANDLFDDRFEFLLWDQGIQAARRVALLVAGLQILRASRQAQYQ